MNRIEKALAAATDTKDFVLGAGVLKDVAAVYNRHFAGQTATVVADPETWAAAGERVSALLREAGIAQTEPYLFGHLPHPTGENSEAVAAVLRAHGSVCVAVGSGCINDICKYGSELVKRPYLCVATAASVDGYASFGAAMQMKGFKCTMPCPAPRAIVADTDVIKTAPRAMTASGYADLLAKITGGADWIIADAVGAHPIRADIWEMVQPALDEWLARPEDLFTDDTRLGALFEGLTISGFAMQAMHDSRPASGAEHLFSHCWEMHGVKMPGGGEASHGQKVGIGTIYSTRLMENVFARPFTAADVDAAVAAYPAWEEKEREVAEAFGAMPDVCKSVLEATRAKYLTRAALRERLEKLVAVWPELSARVKARMYPSAEIVRRMEAIGAMTTPEEIGAETGAMLKWARMAQLIRTRYTILDLAAETNRFAFG